MSRVCSVCGKKAMTGNNVSHANNKTKTTFKVNVQKVQTENGKEYVCTKCLKTMKKSK